MMQFVFVTGFIITLIELIIFQKKILLKTQHSNIQKLDKKLDIIKALSYLPASKNQKLVDDLNNAKTSILLTEEFDDLKLIYYPNGTENNPQVFNYRTGMSNFEVEDNLTNLEHYLQPLMAAINSKHLSPDSVIDTNSFDKRMFQINSLQKTAQDNNLILTVPEMRWQSLILTPISFCGEFKGFLIFASEKQRTFGDADIKYIEIISRIITVIIKKFEFNKLMDFSEQIKAVNITW